MEQNQRLATSQISPLEQSIQRLYTGINSLGDELSGLYMRLEPLLLENLNKPPMGSTLVPMTGGSPAVMRIIQLTEQLENMLYAAKYIKERLEV